MLLFSDNPSPHGPATRMALFACVFGNAYQAQTDPATIVAFADSNATASDDVREMIPPWRTLPGNAATEAP